MNQINWIGFTDHFIQAVQCVMPIDGFISYDISGEQQAENFYHQGVKQISLDEYVSEKQYCDPVHFQVLVENKLHCCALKTRKINAEYAQFMQKWQIHDHIELIYLDQQRPVRGVSLIREQRDFSTQDFAMIESLYAFSNHLFSYQAIPYQLIQETFGLTRKELEILKYICKGFDNLKIANTIFSSLATVKTHVRHIFQKADVGSKQELLSKVMRFSSMSLS